VAASNPLSQRQLMERFGLSRAQERTVPQSVTMATNGQG
jgi:hypothetical protein